jgi:hypothetical protein
LSADGDAAHGSGLGPRPLDPPPGAGRFARAADPAAQAWAAAAPPPGTYAPAVAAQLAELAPRSHQEARGTGGGAELSPAARRCLTDVFALLDRATALLAQAADIVAQEGQAEPRFASAAGRGTQARTAAVDLAVRGLPRGQVGERLVAEHGVSDPGPLLDDVFGSGTPASRRLVDQVTRRP